MKNVCILLNCNATPLVPFFFSCIFFWVYDVNLLDFCNSCNWWLANNFSITLSNLIWYPIWIIFVQFWYFFKLEGIYTLAFKLWHYDRLMVEVWNLGVFLKRTFYMVEDNLYMALRVSRNGLYRVRLDWVYCYWNWKLKLKTL